MRSPKLGSSPFAKHTQQPFVDNASCRSRLSDYGFTSESEDEQDWGGYYADDMETPTKDQGPPEDFGFWAEVGAVGGLSTYVPWHFYASVPQLAWQSEHISAQCYPEADQSLPQTYQCSRNAASFSSMHTRSSPFCIAGSSWVRNKVRDWLVQLPL